MRWGFEFMSNPLLRTTPLEDWEKVAILLGLRGTKLPLNRNIISKCLQKITDWPFERAEKAVAEAHLKGVIETYNPDAD